MKYAAIAIAALLLVASMATAQTSRPTSRPSSRPAGRILTGWIRSIDEKSVNIIPLMNDDDESVPLDQQTAISVQTIEDRRSKNTPGTHEDLKVDKFVSVRIVGGRAASITIPPRGPMKMGLDGRPTTRPSTLPASVAGTIVAVDATSITVRKRGDEQKRFSLKDTLVRVPEVTNERITDDGRYLPTWMDRPGEIADLKPGQEISVLPVDDRAATINILPDGAGEHRRMTPSMFRGTIVAIDAKTITLDLKAKGDKEAERKTFNLDHPRYQLLRMMGQREGPQGQVIRTMTPAAGTVDDAKVGANVTIFLAGENVTKITVEVDETAK